MTSTVCALVAVAARERRRRRRLEVEAQRNLSTMADMDRRATMSHFTASLAHELRQPLAAILQNAAAAKIMLDSGNPSLLELREIIEDIRQDDRRASEIISRIKAVVQKHDPTPARFDISEVLHESVSLARKHAAVSEVGVDLLATSAALTVVGDRVHVQQVLMNLLLNAIDAAAPFGGRVEVVATAEHGYVHIAVRDHGPGLTDAAAPHLFEQFFTTKPDGMGMGLFIARNIVEAHRGRIVAENHADGGAVVRVSFPAA